MIILTPKVQGTGKGFFLNRLKSSLSELGVKCVHNPKIDHDVYLDYVSFKLKSNKPHILRLDGVNYTHSKRSNAENKIIQKSVSKADAVVFQSEFCNDAVRRRIKVSCFTEVIMNGDNPNRFNHIKPADSDYRLNLFTAARWRRHKRLKEIVKSFLLWDNADSCLWIAGQADYQVNHPRIRYLGPLSQSQLASYYRLANAFIHISYIDSCPNAVVESICSGTPVLSNNVGGNPEVVGESGEVCDIDKPYNWKTINPYKPPRVDLSVIAEGMAKVVSGNYNCNRSDLNINTVAKKYISLVGKMSNKETEFGT